MNRFKHCQCQRPEHGRPCSRTQCRQRPKCIRRGGFVQLRTKDEIVGRRSAEKGQRSCRDGGLFSFSPHGQTSPLRAQSRVHRNSRARKKRGRELVRDRSANGTLAVAVRWALRETFLIGFPGNPGALQQRDQVVGRTDMVYDRIIVVEDAEVGSSLRPEIIRLGFSLSWQILWRRSGRAG